MITLLRIQLCAVYLAALVVGQYRKDTHELHDHPDFVSFRKSRIASDYTYFCFH